MNIASRQSLGIPNYALAYTGLAATYVVQGAFGIVPPRDIWVKARQAAQRAVELDDTLPEAHGILGGVKLLYEWDWPAAEKELRRAVELNPNYAEAHELYAFYFWVMGDFDRAFSEIKRAQELSPVQPILTLDLATMFYYQSKYEEALSTYRKLQEEDPNMLGPIFVLAQIHERNGKYDQALAECKKALSVFGRQPAILSSLAYVHGVTGDHTKAQDLINEMENMWRAHYFSPFVMALAHAGAGIKDAAFMWLTKAYESRDPQLIWLMVEPQFENIRADDRFKTLSRQMGIPESRRL